MADVLNLASRYNNWMTPMCVRGHSSRHGSKILVNVIGWSTDGRVTRGICVDHLPLSLSRLLRMAQKRADSCNWSMRILRMTWLVLRVWNHRPRSRRHIVRRMVHWTRRIRLMLLARRLKDPRMSCTMGRNLGWINRLPWLPRLVMSWIICRTRSLHFTGQNSGDLDTAKPPSHQHSYPV